MPSKKFAALIGRFASISKSVTVTVSANNKVSFSAHNIEQDFVSGKDVIVQVVYPLVQNFSTEYVEIFFYPLPLTIK